MEEGVHVSKHRFRLMSLVFRHPVSDSKYSSNLQNHRRIQSRIFESSNPIESAMLYYYGTLLIFADVQSRNFEFDDPDIGHGQDGRLLIAQLP